MFGYKLFFCIVFVVLKVVKSDKIFPTQWLGNYLSQEEYDKLEKCDTENCLHDADRLIYAATRNGLVKPCDDFKTFSMGEFYLHRKRNDRYPRIGFKSDVEHLSEERYKTVLNKPIYTNESKVIKFVKSYFKKCSDLANIKKRGGDELISFLNSSLGLTLITKEKWDETKFDVTKLIELEPRITLYYFTSIIFKNKNELWFDFSAKRPNYKEVLKLLKSLNLGEGQKKQAFEDYEEYLGSPTCWGNNDSEDNYEEYERPPACWEYYDSENPTTMRIQDFSAAFPHLKINWLKFFNDQLLPRSQFTADQKIVIIYADSINRTMLSLSKMDKRVLANAYTVMLLYHYNHAILTHFLNTHQEKSLGTKQSFNRFQKCIEYLKPLKLALDSLLSKEKFNKETQSAAEKLVKEAISDFMTEVEEYQTSVSEEEKTKQHLLRKLKKIQTSVMFLDEVLNDTIIDEIHEGLDGNEAMTFIELQVAVERFGMKLLNEKESSWFNALTRKNSKEIEYFHDEDFLVVPAQFTLPPYFLDKRSKFFNMATLYSDTITKLKDNLMIRSSASFYKFYSKIDSFETADRHYRTWEENGGKELQLSAFKMTNRQMLWLCFAHVNAAQYHDVGIFEQFKRIERRYFHFSYKRRKGFKEAFQCKDSPAEARLISEYEENYSWAFT